MPEEKNNWNYNKEETILRCIDKVKDFFNVDNWQINQPIIKDDLLVQIAKVDGVQAVPRLQIVNKYQQQDGSDYAAYSYNLNSNTTDGIIYPSADPCIFELRYPQTDIVGTATQWVGYL